ncbi:MAG: chromosome segregation protein SMC [Acidobacteriota bacterium]
MGALRLASLSLEGFKSFAAKAELSFPGDLIAIIGPNGAGKSNICDAIAWVLGEQSARLLRSQTMADVIFNGAPKRAQSGSATVSLVLAAGDGRWAEADGRLEISRRVLRDGTSDYRIGGRRARLKDVVDQLMDAGLGTRSYAIIEQGRIGQVLSVRAIERRQLFEEAAGITKFRVRRHEAELKLAETRANLLRLADVTSEVKRSLEQARRQARRAEHHVELRRRLLEVRAALFGHRRVLAVALLDQRRGELVGANEADAAAGAAASHADAALEVLRRELDAAQEALASARAEEARTDAAAQRREAEEVASRREYEDASARERHAGGEAERLAVTGRELAAAEAGLVAAVHAAAAALEAEAGRAGEAIESATRAEQAAREASALAEEARRGLLAGVAAATEARNQAHRFDVELEQARYQSARLSAERDRLSAHLAQAAAAEEDAAAREQAASAQASAAEVSRQELRAQREALATRTAERTAERDHVGHARWQARHEREGLERALANARALPQALARALPEEAVRGTVSDLMDPAPDAARHLDQAYGDLLRLPVLASERSLRELIDRLPHGEGRLQVAIAGDAGQPRASALLDASGAAEAERGWLSRALPRAAVASSLDEAAALAADDPDLVVVLPGGGRRHGQRVELPGQAAAVPGVLELRTREREVASRERELQSREEGLVAELERLRAEAADLDARLAEADDAARRATEALAAVVSTRETLHRERARLERELEALGVELNRLGEEASSLERRLLVVREDAIRLEARASELEAEVDRLARLAASAQQEEAAARAGKERARGLEALARERHGAAERDLERHRAEVAALAEREAAARAEIQSAHERAAAAAQAAATARADLEELLARRTAAHHEVERLEGGEGELRTRVHDAATSAETARAALLLARDASHAARLALTEAQAALERIDEAIALTLGGQVELPAQVPTAEELAGLEAEEGKLAVDLEALGPVNELAVAEKDELETRFRFLQEQRRDLEHSMETLNATVTELDATCAERFLATLAEANTAFDEVFRELFGGGEARAELSDPDAPLDSGIEIRVRPPGKHTQSVLLLSGGEKALAAVALLVALFRIRPAPFCVLDEVDAPLDDANVERLCRLLRRMTSDTQFVLITHNRRTMAHADVLYGVTMEEPGVSRIVSVRLEE